MSWGYFGLIAAGDFMNGMSYAIGGYRHHRCDCPPPRPLFFHRGPAHYLGFRHTPCYDFYGPGPDRFDFFDEPLPYGYGRPCCGYGLYRPSGMYRAGYELGELIGYYADGGRSANYSNDYSDYGYYGNRNDYSGYRDYSGYANYEYRGSYERLNINPNSGSSTARTNTASGVTAGSQRAGTSSSSSSGNSRYEYGNYPKMEALGRAAADTRLEAIGGGGTGWSCSSASFANDITYATKGTSRLLDATVAKIRKTDPNFTLLITSALGTATSPHKKNITCSHYNPNNVKLDFGGALNKTQADAVAAKLMSTGYYQFANVEYNGGSSGTYHIDAMFKPDALARARNGEI